MKKIFLKTLIVSFLLVTTIYSKWYITPKQDDVIAFPSSTSSNPSNVNIQFGEIYLAGELQSGRYRIDEFNVWVDSTEVLVNLSPTLLRHQLFYLERYERVLQRDKKRVEKEVKNNPNWDDETKNAILNFQILPNWPESLVVSSWGKPDGVTKQEKDGKIITRIRYGNRFVILEDNQVKKIRREPPESLDIKLDRD